MAPGLVRPNQSSASLLCFLGLKYQIWASEDTQYSWAETTPVVQCTLYCNLHSHVFLRDGCGGQQRENVHLILGGRKKNKRQQISPKSGDIVINSSWGRPIRCHILSSYNSEDGRKVCDNWRQSVRQKKGSATQMGGVLMLWVYAGGGLNSQILWKYIHEMCFHQWGVDCGLCQDVLRLVCLVQGSVAQLHTLWLRLWYCDFLTRCLR